MSPNGSTHAQEQADDVSGVWRELNHAKDEISEQGHRLDAGDKRMQAIELQLGGMSKDIGFGVALLKFLVLPLTLAALTGAAAMVVQAMRMHP